MFNIKVNSYLDILQEIGFHNIIEKVMVWTDRIFSKDVYLLNYVNTMSNYNYVKVKPYPWQTIIYITLARLMLSQLNAHVLNCTDVHLPRTKT